MNVLKNHSFFIFLFLTIIGGVIIFYPYINFQDFLAQGDHGRDLYAAEAVLRGEIPYKNFWWDYGPLMPYYYALFFKFFGIQITSILLGKMLLNIACGVFCFLAVSEIFFPSAAFAVALWLMCFQQDFFFTYNHIGGIALIVACIWMHLACIRQDSKASAYTALAFVFLLGLVKINFGLIALLMTILTVNVFGKAKRSFYLAGLFLSLAWAAIYCQMTHGLTVAEIRQCFPYLKGDEPYNHLSLFQTMPMLFHQYLHQMQMAPELYAIALIISICLMRIAQSRPNKEDLFLIVYAALFYLLNLNEYIVSGVFYRSFWAQPPGILLCAFLILMALNKCRPSFKKAFWAVFILICLLHIKQNDDEIKAFRTPAHFLDLPKTHIYIKNDPHWIQTVEQTTLFLDKTLGSKDTFLAMPYDCLYYYLTDKRSPTRQLIIFEHIKIPAEQERGIISQLTDKRVRFILISSRQSTAEPGHGIFGKTYCPTLYNFIRDNYYPIGRFGEWIMPSGWIRNHGTMLLKLKDGSIL